MGEFDFVMKKKLAVLVFILFLFNSDVGFSKTTYLMSLQEAMDIALTSSTELNSHRSRKYITEARIINAKTPLNPAIISDNGTAEFTYRVGIQQTFELGEKRKKRTTLAVAEHQYTQEEILAKTLDIKSKVRKAYIELYRAQQAEISSQEILNTINELVDITKRKEMAGDVPTIDTMQTELMKINAENDLQYAKLDIIQAFNNLNFLLGHKLDECCQLTEPQYEEEYQIIEKLSEDEHEINLDSLYEKALENRPEIKMAQTEIDIAKKQLEVDYSNRIPNLLLAAGPDYVVGPGPRQMGAFIMGAIAIPVFDRQQGEIMESKAEIKMGEKKLEWQKHLTEVEVKNAYNRIQSYILSLKKYKNELLPHSEVIVHKTKQSFDEGKDDIIVPLMAHQSYIKIKAGYIKVLAEYQTAVSDLERAMGVEL